MIKPKRRKNPLGLTVRRHQAHVGHLASETQRTMITPIEKERLRFVAKLKTFMKRDRDGNITWSPAHYKRARELFAETGARLEKSLHAAITEGTTNAQNMAIAHFHEHVQALGKPKAILDHAAVKRTIGGKLKPHLTSKAARFGSSRGPAAVGAKLQKELGADILRGRGIDNALKRGLTLGQRAVHTVAHRRNEFASVESASNEISSGLFDVFERWSARIIKTEIASAYQATQQEAMVRTAPQTGINEKIWTCEEGACEYCADIEDQVVDVGESFEDDDGEEVDPPAHPNCLCGAVPYDESQESDE